jgi:hypothetical protein
MPNTAFLAPLYRSPICVAGGGSDKGKVLDVFDLSVSPIGRLASYDGFP